MSTARINIMTQRPVLRRLKHLTLKYFEIFCADTIPLLMLDADHAEAVYGPAGASSACPARSRASCSMPCAARITTGRLSRTFAGILSPTSPTTGASRNYSPRCRTRRVSKV